MLFRRSGVRWRGRALCRNKIVPALIAARTAFTGKIIAACAGEDLLIDFAYAGAAGQCETSFSIDVVSNETAAQCIARAYTQAAELLFGAEQPRARELIVQRSQADSQFLADLPAFGFGRGLGLSTIARRPLNKCAKALTGNGSTFADSSLSVVDSCLASMFKCEILKSGDDGACIAKAAGRCHDALAKLDAKRGATEEAVAKAMWRRFVRSAQNE